MSQLEELFAWQIRSSGVGFFGVEIEHKFHPKRKWRFDFAWPDKKLALEIEGGVWSNGRHVRGKGFTEDCEKYSEAAALGWRVIRVTGDMIKSGKALDLLEKAL